MAPALSCVGLLPSLARPAHPSMHNMQAAGPAAASRWQEKPETIAGLRSSPSCSKCRGSGHDFVDCPSSIGRGIRRRCSISVLPGNSQISLDSSPASSESGPVHAAVDKKLEFPAREKPESWSTAQRALVDRTVDLGLHLDLGGDGHIIDVWSNRRRAELVEEVRAGAELGVFYLKNFGVDMELLQQVRQEATLFFTQSREEKEKVGNDRSNRSSGYSAKFSSASNSAEAKGHAPSFRQLFRFSMSPQQARAANTWPPEMTLFREKFSQYSAKFEKIVEFLMALLAEGLGLPPSYITDRYGTLFINGLLTHSPPQQLLPGYIAAPALMPHSDTNMFNINVSDGVRGIQYYLDGQWLTMPALLDAALVSFGDDMETISNGRYHAPYHRVLTGPRPRLALITTVALGDDNILEPAAELAPARYRTRRRGDRWDEDMKNYRSLLKIDRTKAGLLLDPDSQLDKTRNIYDQGGQDYINGQPVIDWGEMLTNN